MKGCAHGFIARDARNFFVARCTLTGRVCRRYYDVPERECPADAWVKHGCWCRCDQCPDADVCARRGVP